MTATAPAGSLTADDPAYVDQFDVAVEAAEQGNAIDIDLPAAWTALRKKGSVQKGEPRELLDLPRFGVFAVERESMSLLTYQACAQALRDNITFSSVAYAETHVFRGIGPSLIEMVGNEHKAIRSAAQPPFLLPRAKNWWATNWINQISTTLLNRLETLEGPVDLNIELCARLPIHTVIRGVGIDSEQALHFRENLLRVTGARRGTPEQMMAAPGEVARLLKEVIVQRRAEPGDDVITQLIGAEVDLPEGGTRPLTDDEIVRYCQVIILAGSATTWRQLGMAIHALMTHYEFWEACRDDRSLIPQAIEEAARWSSTQQVFPRLCTVDTEVDGHHIPAGTRLYLCAGSANRDPARWDNPDAFDLFREKKVHLGFGMGAHICLGMHVAKEEMVLALNGLMDRFPHMRANPDIAPAQVIGALEQRGMNHVSVLLR